jgi:hypothetical protein
LPPKQRKKKEEGPNKNEQMQSAYHITMAIRSFSSNRFLFFTKDGVRPHPFMNPVKAVKRPVKKGFKRLGITPLRVLLGA